MTVKELINKTTISTSVKIACVYNGVLGEVKVIKGINCAGEEVLNQEVKSIKIDESERCLIIEV